MAAVPPRTRGPTSCYGPASPDPPAHAALECGAPALAYRRHPGAEEIEHQTIGDTIASIQQILDRDYAHLEWRVLTSRPVTTESEDEPLVYVHARTHDIRYRCRVARPWTTVTTAPTLRFFVAEVAAEAERTLAEQSAAAPK